MRIAARTPKYFALAVGLGALAIVALLLATESGGAQHEGGYLEFTGPGSGFMEVADNAALNPTEAITIEAWIYLKSYGGWGTDPAYTTPPLCPELVGKNWEEAYALALGCGGDVMDSFINADERYANTPTIPLQTWTHVAMTYDGTTRANFVNGQVALTENAPAGPIGDTADALHIGNDVRWDLSPDGRIDDVHIWNIARTQAEIAAGMSGVPSDAPGLVAQWTFDGGSLVDSASGLSGTLMGDVQIGYDWLPGDVICDGQIKVNDAAFLLALRSGLHPTPAPIPCAPGADRADADCDGDSDLSDVLAILKHVANVIQLATSCPSPG